MRKLFLIFAFACSMSANIYADPVDLSFSVEIIGQGGTYNPLPKSPIEPPSATLDGYTLTFDASHPAYTLTLIDEKDEVAWQVTVPANVSIVYLPATLSGNYVLTLYSGGLYYYWSEIIL